LDRFTPDRGELMAEATIKNIRKGAAAAAPPGGGDQAVQKTHGVFYVTDSRGRSIGIKKPTVLQRLRLFEIVGAENSKNEMYLGYASLALLVVEIDGEHLGAPTSKREMEALVQQLDDDGLNAVAAEAARQFGAQEKDEQRDVIKN
jgi:hypothetical protein